MFVRTFNIITAVRQRILSLLQVDMIQVTGFDWEVRTQSHLAEKRMSSEFSLENEVIKPYLHGLCVGKFRTNVAAVAGSCDCVQLGVFCEPVGECRTNVAAVAGSGDCVSLEGI